MLVTGRPQADQTWALSWGRLQGAVPSESCLDSPPAVSPSCVQLLSHEHLTGTCSGPLAGLELEGTIANKERHSPDPQFRRLASIYGVTH